MAEPENWAPPWSRVLTMAQWGRPLGVKLAPGIDHALIPEGFHAQWLSVAGSLVEATMWSPDLAPEGPGRSAALLTDDGDLHLLHDPGVAEAASPIPAAPTGPLGEYLFEPDPAVIRSGTLAHLAQATGTHLISPSIAYLSGQAVESPFLTAFQVKGTAALRTKAIARVLRELDAGTVEVKKRGADIDPSAWQKLLQGSGKNAYVVFATRIQGAHRAIIATRQN